MLYNDHRLKETLRYDVNLERRGLYPLRAPRLIATWLQAAEKNLIGESLESDQVQVIFLLPIRSVLTNVWQNSDDQIGQLHPSSLHKREHDEIRRVKSLGSLR